VKARYPDAFFTGKDLFSSGLFSNPNTTSLFYTFIAELSLACNKAQPTRTHHFIHKLERTGRLLRSYTQNVDGLERRLGLESGGRGNGLKKKTTRNVELHGDLGRVRCVLCMTDYPAKEEWVGMFQEGFAPDCPACAERCKPSQTLQTGSLLMEPGESRVKRSARATTVGTLRPAIVLYDEPHPLGDDIGELQGFDLSRGPDILLIMGTSLKVHGLKRLVKDFAKAVHTPTGAAGKKGMVVFVNATPPGKEWEGIIDVHVHGTTDRWVEKVEEEWRRIKPGDWEVQTRLDGEMAQVKGVKEVEQVPKAKPGSKPGSKPKGEFLNLPWIVSPR
jgi:NAD-dependent histone deacetylase SIR2